MLFGYTNRALFSKYLSLTRNCEENRFFLHQFLLKGLPVHVCQLLDGAQTVEVLGNVDAAAIEMDSRDVWILDEKFQNSDDCFPMTEGD